ncbi:Crp/Fnr family transcriptional regulator [Enterobacter bugandensis]|uniref:Crp/Fnr family transcriptional regulator n=1 Tax=Enterobacter bugandensis TaxID=881260 RepID=UPI000793DCFB|nr:Crp/Fnr family transcriptional regulator [Enterobacter bugandensis]SAI60975.1 CarD family transcriptional regulator [Enterobacter bugandensis]
MAIIMNDVISLLKNAPPGIARGFLKKTYKTGDYVIRQGACNDHLCFLLRGEVEVMQVTHEGSEFLIKQLHAQDVFGELEIFDKAFKTNAVIAITACEVVKIAREYVFEWMKLDPTLSKYLFSIIVERYVQTCTRFDHLSSLTIRQRLLLSIDRHLKKGDLEKMKKCRLMQEVGVPRRSLNRVLAECYAEGLISYNRGVFAVTNQPRLAEIISTL